MRVSCSVRLLSAGAVTVALAASPAAVADTVVPLPAAAPSAARTGLIAFVTEDAQTGEDLGIAVMDAGGTDVRRIYTAPEPPEFTSQRIPTARLSSDGRRVVFALETTDFSRSNEDRTRSRIFVMDADGSDRRRLGGKQDSDPAFSPDGTRIAFMRKNAVHLRPAEGSGPATRLTPRRLDGAGTPAFSPDGKRIVYALVRVPTGGEADEAYSELFVVRAGGAGTPKQLTRVRDIGGDSYPAFSPDGRFLVFERVEIDVSQIWLMRADGSRQRRVPTGGLGNDRRAPTFSPSGKRILYAAEHSTGNNQTQADIVRADRDGSNRVRLTRTTTLYESSPSWSR